MDTVAPGRTSRGSLTNKQCPLVLRSGELNSPTLLKPWDFCLPGAGGWPAPLAGMGMGMGSGTGGREELGNARGTAGPLLPPPAARASSASAAAISSLDRRARVWLGLAVAPMGGGCPDWLALRSPGRLPCMHGAPLARA